MRPNHPRPSTKADETPEFKELWENIWPAVKSAHDARALARDAFFRHVWWRGADPLDIVDAARFYARNAKDLGQKFMLMSSWLDRGFYEDMAEQERAYQRRVADRLTEKAANTSVVVNLPPNHFMNKFRSAS